MCVEIFTVLTSSNSSSFVTLGELYSKISDECINVVILIRSQLVGSRKIEILPGNRVQINFLGVKKTSCQSMDISTRFYGRY